MKTKSETDLAIAFVKLLIEKVLAIKYIYIASIVLFVSLAFLYNKLSPKVYQLNSVIGPVKETRSTALESNDMFRGYGSSPTSGRALEDAINSLTSFSMISKNVNDLNLEVGYFMVSKHFFGQFSEIYQQAPFIVNIDKSHIQTLGAKFNISILNNSTFRLTVSKKKTSLYNYIDNEIIAKDQVLIIDTLCQFNETISNHNYKFSISPKKDFLSEAIARKNVYCFEFYHPEELAKYYMKNLKVEPLSYLASIIKIQFSSENLDKSLIFLNTYVNSFLEDNLAKKNKIAQSTIAFIDNQITEMSDSLGKSESKLRNFRSDNQVMDLGFQGQKFFEQLTQVQTERTNIELQIRYYNYVLNFFKTAQDISGVTPPSSANITDPIMNKLISDLSASNAERLAISNNNEKNLFLVQIENKIKIQKQSIIENVTNNLNTLNLTLNELNYKAEKLSKDISNLPKQEMNMVNIQRKFNLNNTIYTYLLQKRSEAAITLASNYPDYEVLEPAREITSEIIKPKSFLNYFLALFLSILIPTIFLIIREILNNKISSVYDVEHLIDRSVFGIIYRNPKKYESVVAVAPRSAIAESFRNIRSSLFLKLKSQESKIILITSSQPQDGKSFISLNLASSIASVGYKTVLIDCDLRRPVLHDKLKEVNSSGISDFMTQNASVSEIIHNTSVENLSFIPAGPLLPNPSELIDSGALDDLINFLKSKFDYIIIDTPPLGLVSDSMQLMKYANQILLISRIKYTQKEILENAIASLDTNNIRNYDVILNDLNLDKSPYSGYKGYYHKE